MARPVTQAAQRAWLGFYRFASWPGPASGPWWPGLWPRLACGPGPGSCRFPGWPWSAAGLRAVVPWPVARAA